MTSLVFPLTIVIDKAPRLHKKIVHIQGRSPNVEILFSCHNATHKGKQILSPFEKKYIWRELLLPLIWLNISMTGL